jgi:peptide/nickel transport system ATP-binding protein
LEVRNVTVRYAAGTNALGRAKGHMAAVNNASLTVNAGETVSIVGESASGKTSLANAVVGLVPPAAGDIFYKGQRLKDAAAATRREIQMVFQDPRGSLDPRWPAWRIITEPMTVDASPSRRSLIAAANDLMRMVGLDPAMLDRLPHAFSGGQRQRLAIARALAVRPRLLVLDEPTSALDVSVQAQILNLLLDLQDAHGLSYLFISHNVSVVAHISDRVVVMRAGEIVESGAVGSVLASPQHPYTQTLMAAVPRLSA